MEGNGLQLQGGTLQRVPPAASLSEITTVLNDIVDRLNEQLKTQIYSDGLSKRMIFGFQKNGWGAGKDFGIKISIEGVDVTTATDAQLLFKMDMETWNFQDPTGRSYTKIGLRSTGTHGFEMAKPTVDLND